MGTNDLAKEMRVAQSETRDEFQYAFGKVIMAARAHNCDVLDGVYNQLDNQAGLAAICQQGKGLGFDGKTLIHPKQIPACHHAFSPSDAAIAEAREIIAAWQQADQQGVIVVNNKLVEALHVQEAQRIVDMQAVIDAAAETQ